MVCATDSDYYKRERDLGILSEEAKDGTVGLMVHLL